MRDILKGEERRKDRGRKYNVWETSWRKKIRIGERKEKGRKKLIMYERYLEGRRERERRKEKGRKNNVRETS